jgi:hypothetical protein
MILFFIPESSDKIYEFLIKLISDCRISLNLFALNEINSFSPLNLKVFSTGVSIYFILILIDK